MDSALETIRVQLNFPLKEATKPIIWHFAHDYGLKFSVRKANIDSTIGGYTVLDLTGERSKIEQALAWAVSEGIEVSAIGATGEDEWVIR
jgi:ABC-type methionine transport system ATPase subunit